MVTSLWNLPSGKLGPELSRHPPQHNASIGDIPVLALFLLDRFARVRARASPMTGRVYTPAILYERIWPYNMGLIIWQFQRAARINGIYIIGFKPPIM